MEEIRKGETGHGLSVAQMLISEGPEYEPELLVVLIEAVIELAAQSGNAEAREYLDNMWPILRNQHLKRLTRAKNN